MRNKTHGAFLADMLTSARYEVLPTPSIEEKVLEHLPLDRTVTVTASPAKGIEATLALAERLARHGYATVPHLAARMVSGPRRARGDRGADAGGRRAHGVRAGRRPGPARR